LVQKAFKGTALDKKISRNNSGILDESRPHACTFTANRTPRSSQIAHEFIAKSRQTREKNQKEESQHRGRRKQTSQANLAQSNPRRKQQHLYRNGGMHNVTGMSDEEQQLHTRINSVDSRVNEKLGELAGCDDVEDPSSSSDAAEESDEDIQIQLSPTALLCKDFQRRFDNKKRNEQKPPST
jgi:hypothetical protein